MRKLGPAPRGTARVSKRLLIRTLGPDVQAEIPAHGAKPLLAGAAGSGEEVPVVCGGVDSEGRRKQTNTAAGSFPYPMALPSIRIGAPGRATWWPATRCCSGISWPVGNGERFCDDESTKAEVPSGPHENRAALRWSKGGSLAWCRVIDVLMADSVLPGTRKHHRQHRDGELEGPDATIQTRTPGST